MVRLKIKRHESRFLIMPYVNMPALSGAFFIYSAVVIIVIIYHYSCRERKIVSTDDMGAACGACCDSRRWRNASLQDVGLICLNEHAQAGV